MSWLGLLGSKDWKESLKERKVCVREFRVGGKPRYLPALQEASLLSIYLVRAGQQAEPGNTYLRPALRYSIADIADRKSIGSIDFCSINGDVEACGRPTKNAAFFAACHSTRMQA